MIHCERIHPIALGRRSRIFSRFFRLLHCNTSTRIIVADLKACLADDFGAGVPLRLVAVIADQRAYPRGLAANGIKRVEACDLHVEFCLSILVEHEQIHRARTARDHDGTGVAADAAQFDLQRRGKSSTTACLKASRTSRRLAAARSGLRAVRLPRSPDSSFRRRPSFARPQAQLLLRLSLARQPSRAQPRRPWLPPELSSFRDRCVLGSLCFLGSLGFPRLFWQSPFALPVPRLFQLSFGDRPLPSIPSSFRQSCGLLQQPLPAMQPWLARLL